MFSENDTMYPSLSNSTTTDLMNVSADHVDKGKLLTDDTIKPRKVVEFASGKGRA